MLRLLWLVFFIVFAVALEAETATTIKNAQEFTNLCIFVKIALRSEKPEAETKVRERIRKGMDASIQRRIASYVEAAKNPIGQFIKVEEPNLTVEFPIGPSTKRVVELLRHLEVRAKETTRQLTQTESEAVESFTKARKELQAAVTGKLGEAVESVGTATAGELSGQTRSTACKVGDGAAETSFAGRSLVVDLLCLCASQTYTTDNENCGFVSHATYIWNGGSNSNAGDIWAGILKGCKDHPLPDDVSSTNLRKAVLTFEHLLGAQAKALTNNGKKGAWALGFVAAHTDLDCSGAAARGMCVDYADESAKRGTIAWRNHIDTAISELDKEDEYREKAINLQRKLEAMLDRAQEILIEANTSGLTGELRGATSVNNRLTEVRTAGITNDKTSAQDLNTINTATIPRFILPWTFLI